jgi:hypothetical protein
MNRINNFFALVIIAAMAAVSCDKNNLELQEEQLEVNSNNISGKWMLVEWNNAPLVEGTYVYLDIVRNGKTYTMYQNMDSFAGVPHVITGSYYLSADVELGAVIRGDYDHGCGEWSDRYVIRSLTRTKMVWVGKNDDTFVQEFSRVDSIPVAVDED